MRTNKTSKSLPHSLERMLLTGLALGCFLSSARADIIINITDAGAGNTRMTVAGSVSAAPDAGSAAAFAGTSASITSQTGANSGRLAVIPTATGVFSAGEYSRSMNPGFSGSGDFFPLDNSFLINPAALNVSGLNVTSASALFTEFGGLDVLLFPASPGDPIPSNATLTMDETVAFDFSQFNPGTWTFGSPGGTAGDGVTVNIGPIPEPSMAPLLASACGLLLLRRRRLLA